MGHPITSRAPSTPSSTICSACCGSTTRLRHPSNCATLEAALTASGVALSEAVPLLAALLSLPLPASYPPLTLTPQRQRQKTLETLLAWLYAEAQRQPVLLIVEDLHWVDPSTLELLSLLIDQCAQRRLCLVLTARPEFHPPWAMVAHLTSLTLRRLAPAEVGRLVTHVVGDKAFPPAVLQEVVRKTDGVPLFVEELTKTVLASGLLEEQEERYALHGPLPPLAIPATLHDALLARLDRLAAAKVVAQLGATIGRTFAYDVVQAVAPLDATTLQGALAQLVEAEIVTQRGLPPQATYTFKHALIQDAAYQSLLRSTRQQYHQRIAQVLAERFPEIAETQPEVLAQHYTAAGLHAQALPYWQRAGQRALERSAHREAVESFEQALSALPHLPETRATREQAIDLRLALRKRSCRLATMGVSWCVCARPRPSRWPSTTRVGWDRSRSFCHTISSSGARMTRPSPPASVPSRSPRPAGIVVLQALANHYLGMLLPCPRATIIGRSTASGRPWHASTGRGAASASVSHPARRDSPVPGSPGAMPSWARSLRAGPSGKKGSRLPRRLITLQASCVASWGIGLLSLRQGDLSRALPLLERAVGLCQDADLPAYFPWMAAPLGAAYTLAGRVADAVPLLTQAMEQATATEMIGMSDAL